MLFTKALPLTAYYHAMMGINFEDYWLLTSSVRVVEKLPWAFSKEIYVCIHDWFGRWPQIHPHHIITWNINWHSKELNHNIIHSHNNVLWD